MTLGNQTSKSLVLGLALALGSVFCVFLQNSYAVTIVATEAEVSRDDCDKDECVEKHNISVFGEDTRRLPGATLTASERIKYNGVGVIMCAGHPRATGFLVSRGVVVTAAHNLSPFSGTDIFFGAEECGFLLLGASPQPGIINASAMHIYPGYMNDLSGEGFSKDIAVLKLKSKFPRHINPLSIRLPQGADFDSQILLVGYHADLTPKARRDLSARQNRRKSSGELFAIEGIGPNFGIERLYGHCADMSGGASGSPVLASDGQVIGINVGTSRFGKGIKCSRAYSMNLATIFDAEVLAWISKVSGGRESAN